MDVKPLESFAKAARRELMVAVEARVSAVLAAGSVARSERADTVRLLEADIAEHGRGHVVDRVAYTWFNRLIALRFMDARGYTDAGVVSPASGHAHGQPEILADAKRGVLDSEVVSKAGAYDAILGLLDGSRRSTDPEGEAYALLLTEYCRHWHRTMSFMFEAEGAYTELLVPAGLLAEGALLSRAREVLTADVCDDVEVIGWLYQFYISERKDEVFAGFKKNKKAGADEIPAATQLFTPHWIVRYLLENSLGRLWMLNRPTSRLVEQMDYYIAPIDEETDFLEVSGPEELTVIDPACGSGHMLTYAFDLLYAIYEEEGYAPSEIPGLILTHNLHGTEIDPRAGALAAFALTMKARAKDRRFFSRSEVDPKICVVEPISFTPDELDLLVSADGDRDAEEAFWNQFRDADVLGSLIQAEADATAQATVVLDRLKDLKATLYFDTLLRARRVVTQAEVLSRRYSVVTANPPYMGARNMGDELRAFAEAVFPNAAADLCTMFIERALAFASPAGAAALVVSESWLFNSRFEEFRLSILSFGRPVVTACIDKAAFRVRLNTAATVFQRSNGKRRSQFFRVTEEQIAYGKVDSLPPSDSVVHLVEIEQFTEVPGGGFYFDMPLPMLEFYKISGTIGDAHDSRQGLATGNNSKFLRQWWEVSRNRIAFRVASREESRSTGCTWFPYNKGGTPMPWWGNQEHVINWADDGAEVIEEAAAKWGSASRTIKNTSYYFRPSITWSNIGYGGARFRYLPAGFVFDVSGMSLFVDDEREKLELLGYLNSAVARRTLDVLAPTLNYQAGDVARMPLVLGTGDAERVSELVQLSRTDWAQSETAHEFRSNPLISVAENMVARACAALRDERSARAATVEALEHASNTHWAKRIADLSKADSATIPPFVPRPVKLKSYEEDMEEVVSFAIGCIFGRYSLDQPGLLLADQGATLQDYFTMVPSPTFMPDADNVIPFVDDGWFEDDIVERFRQFLKVAFGAEHFEENLRFVEESLGVKTLRDYFITKSGRSKFYDDHVKRYKKRPIYWMFSSPKGSFNALIYLHRYSPSTVSTVLNEYLREYENKLRKALERAEVATAGGSSAKDQKEADRLRKVLAELRDYEHDVLYPLATQQVEIDLDDGVKVNYPKFYPAVKKIAGLEASDE
ncbi:BREX-1 system adenine-specific DNA-methyltransferase PglX [Gordonia sp. JH63]|uniref:BREX-1 system adenine-specific DNA-methyltransferase PglX n=1 Tax=Gordonia sp. JH63 TaxID=2698900 RepID=UPI00131FAF3D|nr:BREX-1 system adenine-specific DNA-methyltransferase PglX [Gordonia sp. JH63]QHD86038.1 BREX-1 system adenine-specific DNA-methyltransferase PglX [Gordonia sp. JH63]